MDKVSVEYLTVEWYLLHKINSAQFKPPPLKESNDVVDF